MITFFTLTGFWVWASLAVGAFFLGRSVYKESYGWATFDILTVAALLATTGNLPILDLWHWATQSPEVLAGVIFGYLLIGVAWALIKWKFTLRRLRSSFNEWASEQGDLSDVKNRLMIHLPPHLYGLSLTQEGKAQVRIGRYTSRIIGWMAYWPVSALLWLIGDFFADIYRAVYDRLAGVFQSMADNEFK